MGLQINTNVAALNSYRNLTSTQGSMQTSLERLSSGLRINRAADDAAGLAISEKLRSQVNGLNQAQANAQDGVSLIQTAEGSMNESHSILQRMRTLAVQSASDTNTDDDRKQIQKEVNALTNELNGIAKRTQFNGMTLTDGSFADKKLQIGANENQTMSVSIKATDAGALDLNTTASAVDNTGAAIAGADGVAVTVDTSVADAAGDNDMVAGSFTMSGTNVLDESGKTVGTWDTDTITFTNGSTATFGSALSDGASVSIGLDLSTQSGASVAIDKLDVAIKNISGQRADLGALQNRLDHTIKNLGVSAENLAASESRIRDTDMAKEMTNFTRSQILQQAGTSMLAQANQSSQGVLKLLG